MVPKEGLAPSPIALTGRRATLTLLRNKLEDEGGNRTHYTPSREKPFLPAHEKFCLLADLTFDYPLACRGVQRRCHLQLLCSQDCFGRLSPKSRQVLP